MKIFKTKEELWAEKIEGALGFVPTMGALHQGHASLIQESIEENDKSCVSIFVNPTQFNDAKDLESYPRNLEKDLSFCKELGVDFVYCPQPADLYLEGESISITENKISRVFEGEKRPGHFEGVLQVVLKLLNVLRADRAYFGLKDYQQFLLIQKLAQSFFLKTQICPVEIYRDDFALPFSSRNQKLSAEDLAEARKIARAFLESSSQRELEEKVSLSLDYYGELEGRVLMAHRIGGIRILDNKEKS